MRADLRGARVRVDRRARPGSGCAPCPGAALHRSPPTSRPGSPRPRLARPPRPVHGPVHPRRRSPRWRRVPWSAGWRRPSHAEPGQPRGRADRNWLWSGRSRRRHESCPACGGYQQRGNDVVARALREVAQPAIGVLHATSCGVCQRAVDARGRARSERPRSDRHGERRPRPGGRPVPPPRSGRPSRSGACPLDARRPSVGPDVVVTRHRAPSRRPEPRWRHGRRSGNDVARIASRTAQGRQ